MVFLRYPFSVAVVTLAFVLSGAFFVFFRPQYREHHGTSVDLSGYPAPAHGWTWKGGTPGFVVRTGREEWNPSQVRPSELPHDARLLNAERNMDGLSLLVARGRCIGVQVPSDVAWFCPPQLANDVALVVVDAVQPLGDGYPINLVGAARGDVKRVVITAPEITHVVHRDNTQTTLYRSTVVAYEGRGNWGTFAYSVGDGYRGAAPVRPWRARLDFYGAQHRLLASQQVAYAKPGAQLVVVH